MCESCDRTEQLKKAEVEEDQLKEIRVIGAALFDDESDPASWSYKRVLVRPTICWPRVLGYVTVPAGVLSVMVVFVKARLANPIFTLLCCAAVLVVYILVTLKHAVICAVKIYQRFAPDSIRNKCRFEPSCSQYMILSIEKHGVIRGLINGVDRLKRCRVGNGGFDNP